MAVIEEQRKRRRAERLRNKHARRKPSPKALRQSGPGKWIAVGLNIGAIACAILCAGTCANYLQWLRLDSEIARFASALTVFGIVSTVLPLVSLLLIRSRDAQQATTLVCFLVIITLFTILTVLAAILHRGTDDFPDLVQRTGGGAWVPVIVLSLWCLGRWVTHVSRRGATWRRILATILVLVYSIACTVVVATAYDLVL
jgi:hypothetical protein